MPADPDARRILRRGLAILVACWFSLLLGAAAPAGATPVIRLTQAEFASGNDPTPPVAGWRAVTIPDLFYEQRLPNDRIVWLRFRFDLAERPAEPIMLLAQRVVTTAEFRINGSLLNGGVRFPHADGRAGTQMSNWPHGFALPAGLLVVGPNELLVRLSGDPIVPPWLSGVSIGPAEALWGEYLLRDIPQRWMPLALSILLVPAVVFSAVLWWRERQTLRALYTVTAVLWLFMTATYFVVDMPVQHATYVALLLAVWVAAHWVLLHLLWQLSGRTWRWFPRALAVGSAVPLAIALVSLAVGPNLTLLAVLMLPITVLRLLTTAMLVIWCWRQPSWRSVALTVTETLWSAGPVQTMLVALDLLPPDPFMLNPGNGLPLFLVIVVLAAQAMAQDRQAAARQREAAIAAERQRMMHDMHDGLGAHLAAAVRLARRDDVPRAHVEQTIQDALTDLRLVIDSLDADAAGLLPLLGQWRHGMAPRLQALGMQLEWQVDGRADHALTAPQALDVLRFLQEATHNAMRHAQARTLTVTLTDLDQGWELTVRDDGIGIDPARLQVDGRGRGLPSLRRRALRLGASLDVQRGDTGGTVVSLRLQPQGGQA